MVDRTNRFRGVVDGLQALKQLFSDAEWGELDYL